jgi:hypothetical protein
MLVRLPTHVIRGHSRAPAERRCARTPERRWPTARGAARTSFARAEGAYLVRRACPASRRTSAEMGQRPVRLACRPASRARPRRPERDAAPAWSATAAVPAARAARERPVRRPTLVTREPSRARPAAPSASMAACQCPMEPIAARICSASAERARHVRRPTGTSCGPAQSCAGGVRVAAATCNASGQCPTPAMTSCPSGCNAGGTDCLTCGAGQAPCAGVCCAAGQGCCQNVCVRLDTTSNCGSCGKTCVACYNAAGQFVCPATWDDTSSTSRWDQSTAVWN